MKNYLILLVIFIFCFSISVFSQNSKNNTALEYYNKGIEYYSKGETKKAIEILKKSIKLDKNFSDARNKLAEIYMNQESVLSRARAEMVLKRAIRDDPENFEYRLNLGKTYLKQGFIYNARKCFESLAEKYPKNTEVLSNLGNIYIKYFEKYNNMFAPGPYGMAPFYDNNLIRYYSEYGIEDQFIGYDFIAGISIDGSIPSVSSGFKGLIENRISSNSMGISFARWAGEDYKSAVSSFDKIIKINPKHRGANFQLSILAYDNNDLDSFMYHQKRIIENNPNDKNAHLFLGLGLHEMNKSEEAFKEFRLAKILMDEDERTVFESLDYILPDDMKEEYQNLSGIEQEGFSNKYWRSKDPLYLTDFSERMLEHYCRVAYADLKFGVPKMDIEGWESDRGRIYIRYGKPDKQIKIRPELDFGGPKAGYNFTLIWYYPKYTFVFADPYSSGEFRLSSRGGGSRFPSISFQNVEEDLHKIYPENYDHNYGGELFAFNYYTASFKGEDGNTHMEIYYGIPQKYIQYNPDRGRFCAKIKKGFFIFDEDWDDVRREISVDEFRTDIFPDTSNIFHIVKQNNLEIKPGKYQLAIEIQDESSKNIGICREMISVESFETDNLKLSDIVFAAKIDTVITTPEFSSRGFEIIPNPVRHYKTNQPLYIYYEIYNLRLTAPGVTNYTVEYKIERYKNKRSTIVRLFSGIGRLFGIGTEKEEISTSYKYSGMNPTEKQYLTINMQDAEAGLYQLSLSVSDINSGQMVTKNRTMLVTDDDINYIY